MAGQGEMRLRLLPHDLFDRCVLLGLTEPPEFVLRHLDADSVDALADLFALVHKRAMTRAELQRGDVLSIIGRVNASLIRSGRWGTAGLWTLPPEPPTLSRMHTTGRDALGLDVPAAWGAEVLGNRYRVISGYFGDIRDAARVQRAAEFVAVMALLVRDLLGRATGFERHCVAAIPTSDIEMAWRNLRAALDRPNVPAVDWQLTIDSAAHDATRLSLIAKKPEPPDAA